MFKYEIIAKTMTLKEYSECTNMNMKTFAIDFSVLLTHEIEFLYNWHLV